MNHLENKAAPELAHEWADALTTDGVDAPAVIELAILEKNDWQAIAARVGPALTAMNIPTDHQGGLAFARQLVIARLADVTLNPKETIRLGFKLYLETDRDAFMDFMLLDSDLELIEQGHGDDPSFERLGLRQWSLDYLNEASRS